MADAPRVEGLGHLRRIIWDEIERAKREGVGCLYLEGCLRAWDRDLVDAQAQLLLAAEPDCRLLASSPTAAGYGLTFGWVAATVRDEAIPFDLPLGD